jgi:NAD-dependent deacetylase sirtuin 4
MTCSHKHPRHAFQSAAATLNPSWADLLSNLLESGALTTDDPQVQAARGLRTNPDGDVDLPGLRYADFKYPACPRCVDEGRAQADDKGGWLAGGGVLKPGVVMFGEAVGSAEKKSAEEALRNGSNLLVLGSSLATYSAWRLVKQMVEQGGGIGVLNIGGIRGEDELVNSGNLVVRSAEDLQTTLPRVVEELSKG